MEFWVPRTEAGEDRAAKYLSPFATVWRKGKERCLDKQALSSVFYAFEPEADEVSGDNVKIPAAARAHFEAQAALGAWEGYELLLD